MIILPLFARKTIRFIDTKSSRGYNKIPFAKFVLPPLSGKIQKDKLGKICKFDSFMDMSGKQQFCS